MNHSMGTSNVLVVDDDPYVLSSISRILREYDFAVYPFSNGYEALKAFQKGPVAAVLTDIKMPLITGLELLDKIHAIDEEMPVILLTAYAEMNVAISAIQKGAFDFILKPYDPLHLVSTLKKAIRFKQLHQIEKNYHAELETTVRERTLELGTALKKVECMSREIIERLACAAELRDDDTGQHNSRIGLYAACIARAMQAPEDFIETLTLASTMHDVGKIGISDKLLHKPGLLTLEEFETIKSHTTIGEELLNGSSHSLLQMAARIAHTHHERWDGTGYPRGLKREEIPLEGRIVMLADQYDALRNKRAYKPAFNHEMTCKIIIEGDGRTLPEHFDPRVLQAFIQISSQLDSLHRDMTEKTEQLINTSEDVPNYVLACG